MVEKVGQDPNAHVFYEADWEDWLAARGYLAADIVRVDWAVPAPLVKTFTEVSGAIARVWIKGVPNNKTEHRVTATIVMPAPDVTAPEVTDDFSFIIRATDK